MKSNIPIDYNNNNADLKKLIALIENSDNEDICIEHIIISNNELNQLEDKFENKLIYYIEWNKTLLIKESLSTSFIKCHLEEFLQCFIQFDSKANELMKIMANYFNIDLKDNSQIWDIRRNKSQNLRGQIYKQWNYHFHGSSCSFTNIHTGQFLDVKIIFNNEYGVIDNYFLISSL